MFCTRAHSGARADDKKKERSRNAQCKTLVPQSRPAFKRNDLVPVVLVMVERTTTTRNISFLKYV